jgi:hypothetical protein
MGTKLTAGDFSADLMMDNSRPFLLFYAAGRAQIQVGLGAVELGFICVKISMGRARTRMRTKEMPYEAKKPE